VRAAELQVVQPCHGKEPNLVWIKICGITSVQDARLAVKAGADAIGVNMVAGPRRVEAGSAVEIISAAAPKACPVVLAMVDDGRLDRDAERVIDRCGVHWVQLYGDVTPSALVAQLEAGRQPMPVIRVTNEDFADSFGALLDACGECRPPAVLLDAYHRDRLGGTGEPFRWSWVVEARSRGRLQGWPPIVLAGGLSPDNVAEAIRAVHPWGVDVSSGVEASPGRKDPSKVAAFIEMARRTLQ
jgi:phosphoribosylanthranilate isomerase